jgi:hypothetical protein
MNRLGSYGHIRTITDRHDACSIHVVLMSLVGDSASKTGRQTDDDGNKIYKKPPVECHADVYWLVFIGRHAML